MKPNNNTIDQPKQWRQMPPEHRRQQLIDATIRVIGKKGISQTTVSVVAKEAGLSPAVINLQFESKDNLLVETFKFIREEFKSAWLDAMNRPDDEIAEKIHRLLNVHFLPEICSPAKLRVWFAFLGEASARKTYLEITHKYETAYIGKLAQLCEALIIEGGYDALDPAHVSRSLLASCDGLWLARMLRPETLSPEFCQQNVVGVLASFFPSHFPSSYTA